MVTSVVDYVSLHSQLRPGKLAVRDLTFNRSWSYREFHELVAGCATVLKSYSVSAGDRVAVLSRNRAEFIMIHAACARLGAMIVPLNWRLASAEIRGLLDDCEPALLLGDELSQEMAIDCVSMDDFYVQCQQAEPYAAEPLDFDQPSLILYTSGTSGKPKGVLLSERNLNETAINFGLLGEVAKNSVFLCDSPMFHIIGLVTNVRPAFLQGASVLISDSFKPEVTLARLEDSALSVSHYFCVPQMASLLRFHADFSADKLRSLTAVFTGGAPHPAAWIEAWLDEGIAIVDGFGMSEAGTVLGMPLDPELIRRKAGSVGLPTPRVGCRIVDEQGADLPGGEAGELLLRGDNITSGYWRKPEEQAKVFTDDGWFRTGDVARRDEEGYYWLVDRKKDMFISGGENVYPAEIEALVVAHGNVRECAVVGVPDERWGEVGWLVMAAKAGSDIDTQEILHFLESRLARYKIPKHISVIDELPRNGAGKILKHELRKGYLQEK